MIAPDADCVPDSSSRCARTGRSMFLSVCGPRSSKARSMRLPTCSRTVSETSTPPGSHSCSNRAATLTPSPRISAPSATTSPRFIPIRSTRRSSGGVGRLPLDHGLLQRDGAQHGVDHGAELDESAIAGRLHQSATMSGQKWVDDVTAQAFERAERARLVAPDQPRVADHVRAQDGGQAALDLRFGQLAVPHGR